MLTSEAISIVSVIRTQRFPWEQVSGFIGERRHDEARVLMVLGDERQIALPGTLDPEELDPYGDEGQMLSAADQLNHLREVAISGDLPAPASLVQAPAPPPRSGESGAIPEGSSPRAEGAPRGSEGRPPPEGKRASDRARAR